MMDEEKKELFPMELALLRQLAEDCRRAVGSLVDMRVMPESIVRARGELNLRVEVTMSREDERAVETIKGIFDEALVEKDLFCALDFHTGVQSAGLSLLHASGDSAQS